MPLSTRRPYLSDAAIQMSCILDAPTYHMPRVSRQVFGTFSYFEQPRAYGATYFVSSKFLHSEQLLVFWISEQLIGHASIFHNASVDNLRIFCEKGAVPHPEADHGRKMDTVVILGQQDFKENTKWQREDSHFSDLSVSAAVTKVIQIL